MKYICRIFKSQNVKSLKCRGLLIPDLVRAQPRDAWLETETNKSFINRQFHSTSYNFTSIIDTIDGEKRGVSILVKKPLPVFVP